ncbi:fec operon regulator FecR [compost metagenome]|jgi:transmembrane sensor
MNAIDPMREAPNEALVDQALSLIATADIAPQESADRARARLARWRTRAPDHEAAYAEALRRWQLLSEVAPGMREHFDEPSAVAPGRRVSRRALLGFGLAGAGTAAMGAGWYWNRPLYQQSYETGAGQLAQALMPDQSSGVAAASRVDLSARTRLELRLYRDERVVQLAGGEALFTVNPDDPRPFRVRTRGGVVEVVGTVFTVSDRGGPVSVAVQEGHVRFLPAPRDKRWYTFASGGPAVDLHGGTAVAWRNGDLDPVRRIEPGSVAAWRDGWLWFDNQRLDDALPAINAFRTAPLLAAGPAVGALRLTGRFRTADAAALPAMLESILPLRAYARADGAVELRLR